MEPVLTPYRFTIDQYQRMGETGILHEDDPVELIDGVIVQMCPIGLKHIASVDRCTRQFTQRIGDRAIVRVQSPFRLLPRSEPEPDILILRDRPDFYAGVAAGPEDILLVVEVADSSLDYDRRVKLPRYAAGGIPEAWIVNLVDDCVEVERNPSQGQYREHLLLRRGELLRPQALPDVVIPVEALL